MVMLKTEHYNISSTDLLPDIINFPMELIVGLTEKLTIDANAVNLNDVFKWVSLGENLLERCAGISNPEIQKFRAVLAWVLDDMSEEEKALEIANTIIKSLENIKEENNKAVSSYYRLLSSLQNRCGDYKNAMDNINKAIVMDENNHSNYCVMGDIFINEYEFENAENALKKSLEKSIKNIGEDSPHTASIYLSYSNFYWQTKQENKCLEYAEKAYKMMKKHLGEENLYTVRCSAHWGVYLYHKGQYKKAFEKMEKPAKIIATIFGKENKELIYLNMNLGKILIQLNNYDDLLIFDKYLKGEIYYNFNDTPFENIIKRMCLLVVRKNEKNEYAVGLAYEYDKPRAPKIILKSKNVKGIISCCKKNDIAVELDKSLALALYEDGEIEQIVPSEYWEYIARMFVKIMKKDKNFSNKIKDK